MKMSGELEQSLSKKLNASAVHKIVKDSRAYFITLKANDQSPTSDLNIYGKNLIKSSIKDFMNEKKQNIPYIGIVKCNDSYEIALLF